MTTLKLFDTSDDESGESDPADDAPESYVSGLDLPPLPSEEERRWVRVSELSIYLEWLDEVRELLARHGDKAVEAWMTPTPPANLADELRTIAEGLRELAGDLDEIADAVEHAKHWTDEKMGGRR